MSNKKKGVLADHKRDGKRFIPPMMMLPNLVETSFRDQMLPELLWISAVFNRAHDMAAVHGVIEFQVACQKVISADDAPPLSFLSNFNRLTEQQKEGIKSDPECIRRIAFLQEHLWHQHSLIDGYPLGFIFPTREQVDREEAIRRLKQDVDVLLDRYTHAATKIQTTAVVGMMATKKLFITREVDLPDPNCIFLEPDSEDAKHVASFVRASLNTSPALDTESTHSRDWVEAFWSQAFQLEGCQ